MSLSSSNNSITYKPEVATTEFEFSYPYFATTDIQVTHENSLGSITSLVYGIDYTLSATNGDVASGCTVTTTSSYTSGDTITVFREVPNTQEYDLQNGATIDPTALNKALDRTVAQNQQQQSSIDRCFIHPITDEAGTTYEAPSIANRASKVLGWDANGNINAQSLVESGTVTVDTTRGLEITGNQIAVKALGIDTAQLADDGVTVSKIAGVTAEGSTTARKIEDRFSDVINVKDYGAIGDGVADDYVAISAALSAMVAGQELFFPSGIYRSTGSIVIDKTVKLRMEASDLNSKLLFDTAITRTVQTTATHPDDGTDAPLSAAVSIEADAVELENILVDLYVDYTDTSATNYGTDIDVGIFVKSVSRLIMTKCRTRGYWRIAGVYGDCTADGGTLDRMSLYDCRFQGFWSFIIQGAIKKSTEAEILVGDTRGGGGASDFHISRVWFQGFSHHSKVRKSDTDGGCLKVDGKLYKGNSEINAIQGRNWINCRFDGADRYLLKLENAIRDKFLNSFIDRKTGYLKVDGVTGVGTSDCFLSLGSGTKRAYFRDTDIYNVTMDIDALAVYEMSGAYNEDLVIVSEESFLPAMAFGTGIAYNSRSGFYSKSDNKIMFRIDMDLSAIGTADASQVQIAGCPSIKDNKYVIASVSLDESTALSSPEIAVVSVLSNGNLGIWKATGGILAYTDCNASGTLTITGIAYA